MVELPESTSRLRRRTSTLCVCASLCLDGTMESQINSYVPSERDMHQKTIAAIDIGSNTIHLAVGVSDGEELTLLCDESDMLQLGQDVAASGRIPDAKIKQSLETLRRFKTLSDELHA